MNTPTEPLDHAAISDLRLRILNGDEPTIEEMQALVQTIRAQHSKAAEPKTSKKKKVQTIDLSDLAV